MPIDRKPLHVDDDYHDPDSVFPPPNNGNSGLYHEVRLKMLRWFSQSVWPGMGLFGESYLLFSIGTLKPIWERLFPDCFDGISCRPEILHSMTYSVVLGVILGMLVIGYLANTMGRRKGSILTASLMSGGSICLLVSSFLFANHDSLLFGSMSVFFFVFGFGVGGEYPLSASSASENAMEELRRREEMEQQQSHTVDSKLSGTFHYDTRGRSVLLVFTMQGMGIWFNSLTMALLLLLARGGDNDDYSQQALYTIWRVTYFVGSIILFFVLYTRCRFLGESSVWEDDKQRRLQLTQSGQSASQRAFGATGFVRMSNANTNNTNPPPVASLVSSLSNPSMVYNPEPEEDEVSVDAADSAGRTALLMRNYGMRVFGASFAWCCWDIAFYGNKLFQSSFLLALTGENTTLLDFSLAALLNSTVALLGYFSAAFIVDHPWVGRLGLQQVGLLLTGSLFLGCGFLYNQLSSTWLVAMYLGSSFFGQCGPNATTFLLPAEVFPTGVRTFCHGVSAASGKVGALIAAVCFYYVNDSDMFLLSGYASFVACAVTYWCLPETNGLDLYELDKKWRMILDGRKSDYKGQANSPRYLSTFERNRRWMQQSSDCRGYDHYQI